MSKQIDPQIIHDAIINHIDKTRLLYKDKIPFTFFYNRELTEEQKLAMAWRQGMIDILQLIERELINRPTADIVTHRYMTIEEVNRQYPLNNLSTRPLPVATERHGHVLRHPLFTSDDLIQVTPNLCQSVADYEANMQFDEMRDNEL